MENKDVVPTSEDCLLEIDVDEFLCGTIPDDFQERHWTPEERLYQAVLVQALADATLKVDTGIRRQARAILDAEVGVTMEYVENLCYLAGWEPDYIRRVYHHLRRNKIRLVRKEFSDGDSETV